MFKWLNWRQWLRSNAGEKPPEVAKPETSKAEAVRSVKVPKVFDAESVLTPCRVLMNAGYHLEDGVALGDFDAARRLELELIKKMHELEDKAINGGVVAPVSYKGLAPKANWAGDENNPPEIIRMRDFTGKPTVDDLIRDELIQAYDKAGIPKLMQTYSRDPEVPEAEQMVREVVHATRTYVHEVMGAPKVERAG